MFRSVFSFPPVSFDSGSGREKRPGWLRRDRRERGGYINSGEEGVDKKGEEGRALFSNAGRQRFICRGRRSEAKSGGVENKNDIGLVYFFFLARNRIVGMGG